MAQKRSPRAADPAKSQVVTKAAPKATKAVPAPRSSRAVRPKRVSTTKGMDVMSEPSSISFSNGGTATSTTTASSTSTSTGSGTQTGSVNPHRLQFSNAHRNRNPVWLGNQFEYGTPRVARWAVLAFDTQHTVDTPSASGPGDTCDATYPRHADPQSTGAAGHTYPQSTGAAGHADPQNTGAAGGTTAAPNPRCANDTHRSDIARISSDAGGATVP